MLIRPSRVFSPSRGPWTTSSPWPELGHAWHSWLLRDLPFEQRGYPKTLAETADFFAEIRCAMPAGRHRQGEQRRAIAWLDGRGREPGLDIPARFAFERALVTARESAQRGASQMWR